MNATGKDWRIGLTVKPRYRQHAHYPDAGEVVHVHPSGTNGIVDPDGVLLIRMATGSVITEPAGEWVTA